MLDVTRQDAEEFRAALLRGDTLGKPLSVDTANKTCSIASQFYKKAIEFGHVETNPFDGVPKTTRGNAKRFRFVDRETIDRVIHAAPDAEWRLLIALGRYMGLRIPSEAIALTWDDVLWDQHRMRIRASKTEHHVDGGIRYTPIFPEVAPLLQEAFDLADTGATHVITRYRDAGQNVRTHFLRIIRRAGLVPWPKPWQNLRATRRVELAREHPAGVVNDRLGHDSGIAAELDEHATDEEVRRAAGAPEPVAESVASHLNWGSAGSITETLDPRFPCSRTRCREPHQAP